MALVVKDLPANARDLRDVDSVPGLGIFPGGGNGNPLQYSCLKNPMNREVWRATVHRVTKSRIWQKWLSMQWQPPPKDLSHTPHLLGLLLSVSLTPQQATADPCLHRRPSDSHRQVWLSLLWGSLFLSLHRDAHKVCFLPSRRLWRVWRLILNTIAPLLLSCCNFSFALGCGVSFFGGFQHSPVDDCSAASCDFGVFGGEHECTSFYSTIFLTWF